MRELTNFCCVFGHESAPQQPSRLLANGVLTRKKQMQQHSPMLVGKRPTSEALSSRLICELSSEQTGASLWLRGRPVKRRERGQDRDVGEEEVGLKKETPAAEFDFEIFHRTAQENWDRIFALLPVNNDTSTYSKFLNTRGILLLSYIDLPSVPLAMWNMTNKIPTNNKIQ